MNFKTYFHHSVTCLLFFLFVNLGYSQDNNPWVQKPIPSNIATSNGSVIGFYTLDLNRLKTILATSSEVKFPFTDGSLALFKVTKKSVLSPDLQAKYPGIGTYSGAIGGSSKIDFTVNSFGVLGKVKLVFLHTGKDLLVFISTDISISGKEILETYKKRWNIEQGYKELREHFGFGKEENRIYEALIARITLSFFTYNVVSYINRISNEPKTIGGLFKDLECELHTLAIAMQAFIAILDEIAKIEEVVNRNEDFTAIIDLLRDVTAKLLGFRCES